MSIDPVAPLRMMPTLLADLGGTTSRFALADARGGPHDIVTMANDDVSGPAAAIARYLAQTGARPRAGVLAIAGPIDGDKIALTNRAWRFSLGDLAVQFGLVRLHAINDFEAIAWALPRLGPDDVRAIGPACEPGAGVRLVCGPGTGLGAAALLPADGSWRAIASEAGHASFGAAEADEDAVFARLRAAGSVSAETVLSGPGLARLHQALHASRPPRDSKEVVCDAHAGDEAARATVALFVRLLGRFMGDLALTFKANGAVYVCGGVAGGLGSLFDPKIFRRAFETRPPYERLLAAIPTFMITDPEPGLIGCAVVAERMMRADSVGE